MDYNQFLTKEQKENKKELKDYAYRYFGGISNKYFAPNLSELATNLKKSGLKTSFIEYLSMMLAISTIVFIIQVPLCSIIFGIIFKSTIIGLLLGFFGGLFSAFGVFLLFYIYPKIYIGERLKDINSTLPFATLYLTTMAGGGTPPIAMFRTLSKFDYGEITKECKIIVEETDIIGLNIVNSLKNSAERSPCQEYTDLLWGLRTVIMSGGNIKSYLRDKAKSALKAYKVSLEQFEKKLALMMQGYIILVVVGSVFFMVLTAIMGAMTGGSMQTLLTLGQMVVIFIFIPLLSLGFLLIAKGMSPKAL